MGRKLLLAGLAIAGFPVVADESLQARLADCARLIPDSARLACYDALATRGESELSARPVAPTGGESAWQRPEPVPDKHPETTPTPVDDLFGRDVADRARAAEDQLGIDRAKQLTATIAEARRTGHGKWWLSLTNGQVWEQLDTARLPLSSGDEIVVREARFGSYLLEKSSGSRTIRVRRIDEG